MGPTWPETAPRARARGRVTGRKGGAGFAKDPILLEIAPKEKEIRRVRGIKVAQGKVGGTKEAGRKEAGQEKGRGRKEKGLGIWRKMEVGRTPKGHGMSRRNR